MHKAFLGIGSNLGYRQFNLINCCAEIQKKVGTIVKSSPVYESSAWGYQSSNRFLNQVIEINTKLNPQKLLKTILEIEKIIGRERKQKTLNYIDRPIDIDLLFYDNEIFNTANLSCPHPLLHKRKFVLQPLNDLAPDFLHPLLNKTVRELLKKCSDKGELIKVSSIKYICIEGNIGAGKSTLAKALTTQLNASYLPEQFEESGLLELFYKDPKKYRFLLEMDFLIARYKQLRSLNNTSGIIVSDFSFYKCLWFAKVNLNAAEYRVFSLHYKRLVALLPKPDAIIYLNTSVLNLTNNIKRRGRAYEVAISTNYLKSIHRVYSQNLIQEYDGVKVLQMKLMEYNKTELNNAVETIIKKLMN